MKTSLGPADFPEWNNFWISATGSSNVSFSLPDWVMPVTSTSNPLGKANNTTYFRFL